MKRTLAAALAFAAALPCRAETKAPAAEVDVVFCIDCTGTSLGVIAMAQSEMWAIVNAVANLKPTPVLRIGLIGYGLANDEYRFFDLTDDLDSVYGNLMTFRNDMGNDAWVGAVIAKATQDMKWSTSKDALRIILIVGDKTAAKGPAELMYTKTVPEAVRRDIVVNAIYCGAPGTEEEKTWREVARLADGAYTAIDIIGPEESIGRFPITTPMDKEMGKLNDALNATYMPYGAHGKDGLANQQAQDKNSRTYGGPPNLAQRAQAKSWAGYNCERWDLVDAMKSEGFTLENVKDEDLPEELRGKSLEEKKALIAAKRAERERLQKEINAKGLERQKFIDAEIKARGRLTEDTAFDEAVRTMIREQAARKGMEVSKE